MRSIPKSESDRTVVSDITSPLNVLLLYEDAATGLRAKQLMDQLVEHVSLIVSLRLNLCRFDLLNLPAVRVLDDHESLEADMIVLSAHGSVDLPPAVNEWMDLWFIRNPGNARALVMSLDPAARNSERANRIQYRLQTAGSRTGVDVFPHFGASEDSAVEAAIAGIRYRAETTSLLLDEALQRSGSQRFRYWGINE